MSSIRETWTILIKKVLTCFSIVTNSLCAGAIFTFPLISPALASHCKLTQPQLTTIVLAGMMSQYPFAGVAGKVIDIYGPAACSLIATILFSSAFSAFALEIYNTPDKISEPIPGSFLRLTLSFLVAGLGTVFSYFSSLFAASKSFPNHPGFASGVSMALFGLSPLFLSLIASAWFTNPDTGLLIVSRFMLFLAILTGTACLIGTFTLRTVKTGPQSQALRQNPSDIESENANENTTLLPRKQLNPYDQCSTAGLIRDHNFWLLGLFCVLTLGASEMVISNIGTVVLSLPAGPHTLDVGPSSHGPSTSHQVRLLSLSNTFGKLLVGPLADYVSPVASYLPSGVATYARKHRVSRIAFLSGPSVLLAATFLWMVHGIQSQEALWTLSIGTGVGYSAIFTVLPSIISSIWGLDNLGRNFGIMMCAPFMGTPLFSYMYAFVSASHARDADICEGRDCWQLTFLVSSGASLIALCLSALLWKQWKGRV